MAHGKCAPYQPEQRSPGTRGCLQPLTCPEHAGSAGQGECVSTGRRPPACEAAGPLDAWTDGVLAVTVPNSGAGHSNMEWLALDLNRLDAPSPVVGHRDR